MQPETATVADDPEPSIDDLERQICTLAARLNAVTHDFLVLIRRFDERAGWLGYGFERCSEWLRWRCDVSLSAAREKVRVAHALKTLPAIAMAFARGELSYSKVRALTRVANRENEESLLDFALHTTAARVEERCREMRYGSGIHSPHPRSARPVLPLPRLHPHPLPPCSSHRALVRRRRDEPREPDAALLSSTIGWCTKAVSPSRRITTIAGSSAARMAVPCRPAATVPTT